VSELEACWLVKLKQREETGRDERDLSKKCSGVSCWGTDDQARKAVTHRKRGASEGGNDRSSARGEATSKGRGGVGLSIALRKGG